MSVKVFVYGTLRTGDCRHGLGTFEKLIAPEAYLEGFTMLDLGGFPGLIEGEGRVRGEVHEYATLSILDRIEGYNPISPNEGLYSRREVVVETPEGPIEDCWVYTFNLERLSKSVASQSVLRRLRVQVREKVIKSGDWFEHKGLYDEERERAIREGPTQLRSPHSTD